MTKGLTTPERFDSLDARVTRRGLLRAAIIAMGAPLGAMIFHVATAHSLDLEWSLLFVIPILPLVVLGMGLMTPGSNVTIVCAVATAVMLRKKHWALSTALPTALMAVASFLLGWAWRSP